MEAPICPFCAKPAALVTGAKIYRGRPDLRDKKFWRCKPCDAYVGCHPGTEKPLGKLAKYSTRQARIKAHFHFDQIWRGMARDGMSKSRARRQAYGWLSARLGGSQSNISSMDEQTCMRVIEICRTHADEPFISPSLGDTDVRSTEQNTSVSR